MKTVYLVSNMVADTPTTKVLKFRFDITSLSGGKEIRTEKINLIEWWKWFNSVEEAEQYLETL